MENKNIYNLQKTTYFYCYQILSNMQKTDQNYPKILEIWQLAVIPFFPPGARICRNHILSLGHLQDKIQQFLFDPPAPFSLANKIMFLSFLGMSIRLTVQFNNKTIKTLYHLYIFLLGSIKINMPLFSNFLPSW